MSSPTGSSQWFANPGGDFYNGVATTSLRFEDGDDANLNIDFGSAGSRVLWTFSTWFKRANLVDGALFAAYQSSSIRDCIRILSNVINFQLVAGGNAYNANSAALLRDTSAWYHLVVQFNSADSTETNRTKMWINGEAVVIVEAGDGIAAQNVSSSFGNDKYHTIGARRSSGTNNDTEFDGYMADTHYVNGTALDYTSFAEFKNGVLIPKAYSGSYGTNGFYLKYDQVGVGTASASTIGADISGNTNHLTSSNLVASDCAMPGSPENNFATGLGAGLSPSTNDQAYVSATWSEGNLKMTPSSAAWNNGQSTFGMTSGKWYAEAKVVSIGPSGVYTRFGMRSSPTRTYDEYFWDAGGAGQLDGATSPYSARVGTYANGNVLQIALDLENNAIYFGKNGTWENSATTNEIAAGTVTNAFASGTTLVPTGDGHAYFFYFNMHGHGTAPVHIWNFGQDPSFSGEISAGTATPSEGAGVFLYAPPDGFLACCSANLPEPTIGPNSDTQADEHHNTVLYTGNGGTLSVDGFGHQPDWLWVKSLSIAGNHRWTDSARGVTNNIISNANDAEKGGSDAEDIDSFDSDGFTVTQAEYDDFNDGSDSYVAWSWKANGGTATATISESGDNPAAVVQANPTAGFSLITYTGTGAAGTIAHGLGAVPRMMIIKNRDVADNWAIYHGQNTAAPATDYLILNTTALTADSANWWNDTAPTSSVFTIATDHSVNADSEKYVAYVFADIFGYSKMGKYIGNGNNNGPFVFTGFRPAWIMLKNTSNNTNGGEWVLLDDTRFGVGTSQKINPVLSDLKANENGAEFDSTSYPIADLLSNGFKLRIGGANSGLARSVNNASGNVYIFMAFAHSPVKYANAF